MARRSGDVNPMNLIIAIAIGILTLIAVFSVIPVVGGSIDNAMPDVGADSDWNTTTNPDLPSGASMDAARTAARARGPCDGDRPCDHVLQECRRIRRIS